MKRLLCILLSATMILSALPVYASTLEQEINTLSLGEESIDSELTGELIEITEDITEESQDIAEDPHESDIDESMLGFLDESADILEIVESKPALAAVASGFFNVTVSNGGDFDYTSGANGGILNIKSNGTYEISMKSGVTTTTDRIKVNAGVTAVITIRNVKIDLSPNACAPTGLGPRQSNDSGIGRPFDMKGATVTLKIEGTNSFLAANGCTALFCPKDSKLVIEGSGALTAQTNTGMCVSAIGGEGVLDSGYTQQYNFGKYDYDHNQDYIDSEERWIEFVAQLQGYREWYGDDGVCGDITIQGGTVNANAFVGQHTKEVDDVDGTGKWVYTNESYEWGKDKSSIRDYMGHPIVSESMTAVAIGGAGGGPINIVGGTVNAKSTVRSTTIGSVTNEFSEIHIGGSARVEALNAYNTINVIAMTDTGTDATYGPAIGWASYGLVGDSSTRIVIDGNAVVTARCQAVNYSKNGNQDNYTADCYGGAGIGGGRNGSGGYIEIGGNAQVTALGGMKAAGIGGGIAHNPNKSGVTMGTGIIIIKDNANVIARGGADAAGIGGGAVRNDAKFDDPRNYYYPSEGQAGTIIIEGNASVNATGGKNGAGIGSGGSDTGNNAYNSCQIQNLIITTTGTITAKGGENAANIGIGYLKDSNGVKNNNDGTRVTGVYVNTTDYQSTHPGMDKVPNSIIKDKDGNLVVSGTVDLTKTTVTNPVVTASKQNPDPAPKAPIDNKLLPNTKDVSESIKDYLDNNAGAKIVADSNAPGGTVPSLTIDSSVIIPKDKAQGVSLNGSTVATYTINLSVSGQGKVSIDGGNEATTVKKNVAAGTNVTIKAIPAEGWAFTKWSDNNTSASRNITVSSNTNLTAQFEVKKTDDSDEGENPSDIDIQGMKILTDADREGGYYYTGSAIKPKVTIYDYDIEEGVETLLVSGKDYTVKYVNNINAAYDEDGNLCQLKGGNNDLYMPGVITRDVIYNSKKADTYFNDEELVRFNPKMPYIIVSGRGNYSGYTYINFVINPVLIADEDGSKNDSISISIYDDFASPKKDKAVIKSLKYKKSLKINNDYIATLVPSEDNQSVDASDMAAGSILDAGKIPANVSGEFTLKITGVRNYAGTFALPVYVRSQDAVALSKASVIFNKNSYPFDDDGLDLKLIDSDPALEDNTGNYFAVVLGDKYLTNEDISFEIDDKNAGKGMIEITSKSSSYYGKKSVSFDIDGTPINNAIICINGYESTTKSLGELPYRGEEYSYEDILNELGEISLIADTVPVNDFDVVFSKECKLPGTCSIKFVGKNAFKGSLSRTITIKKADINDATFVNETKVSSSAYEFVNEGVTEPGKDIAKNRGILFNGEPLVAGTDYTIRFSNNKIIGDQQTTMTIIGKGRFTSSKNIPFNIIPREIKMSEEDDDSYRLFSAVAKSLLYKESISEYKPSVIVKYDNVTLKKDRDYALEYVNNSKEAVDAYRENNNNPEPSVKITFNGKYSGTINIPISVYDSTNTINKNTTLAVLSEEYSYIGKNIKPGYKLYYSSDKDVIKQLNGLIKTNNEGEIDSYIDEHLNEGSLTELVEDNDYYVSFGKNIFAGKNGGYLIFNGIGSSKSSYGGSIKVAFRIGGKKMINPVIDFFRNIF